MPTMSFSEAVRSCLTTKYATTSGRARRSEYWWFSLLYVSAAAAIAGLSLATDMPLLNVLLLILIPPMLTVSIRRLHDTGRSGRQMLIALIPVIGPIIYLVRMTVDSTPTANQYGPPPKTSAPPSAEQAARSTRSPQSSSDLHPGSDGNAESATHRLSWW